MEYSQVFIIISCFVAHASAIFCNSDPCTNGGKCYTGVNSYLCVCPGRYTGQNCETLQEEYDYSVNSCTSSTCSNGGTCYAGPNGAYHCLCTSEFTGTQCKQNMGSPNTTTSPLETPCTPDTCANGGLCYTGSLGSFYCACTAGFTGVRCDRVASTHPPYGTNLCLSSPCNNNGTCYTGQESYICVCPAGFTGPHCQTRVFCMPNPCVNGGTCFTGTSTYTCVCNSGFTGDHCEIALCSTEKPCLNGGSCEMTPTDVGPQPLCRCPETHRGPYCEREASCFEVPCQNGGSCILSGIEAATDTVCSCPEDFYGRRCESQIDICYVNTPCLNGGTCYTSSHNKSAFVCSCPAGFEGPLCERSNPCVVNPCQNGGVCSHPLDPTNGMVVCQCSNGFVGLRCEIVDTGEGACVLGACMNGGTCVPSPFASGGRTCTCPDSYTGSRCELQVLLACESNPCLYGATCNDVGDGDYQCICLEGYAGRRCEVIGPCVSSPCMNGGTCVEDVYNPGNFLCHCRNQYTGSTCTIPPQEDPCNSSPCQNGGTCEPTSSGSSYECTCPSSFVGINCDVPDPCSPNPCLNSGTCNAIPVIGRSWVFHCVCTNLYVGLTCAVQRACVSNPCQNGGHCMDITESASQPIYGTELTSDRLNYNCRCPTGWTGQNCESEIRDPCDSNPCQNDGTCYRSHLTQRFVCSCASGFYGPFCDADPCTADPCRNGGICQSSGSEYLCLCREGFSGADCTVENLCHTRPCINGGTCRLTDTSFECICVPGYGGIDCSQRDPCFDEPCLNGGNCITVQRGSANTLEYQCLCQLGYGGLTCGVSFGNVNKCVLNLCENGGSCFRGEGLSYACVCTPEYEGEHCETMFQTHVGASQNPPTQACSSSPCLNGGTCFQATNPDRYACDCVEAFTGSRCETALPTAIPGETTIPFTHAGATQNPPTQACSSSPCLNGGTCFQATNPDRYACACVEAFTGIRCEMALPATTGASTPTSILADTTPFGCVYGDQTFNDGDTWEDGCKDCQCHDGTPKCSNERCKCTVNGQVHKHGESWKQGCLFCSCLSGVASCSDMECRNRCIHDTMIYEQDQKRTDGCNTCTCNEATWECTSNSCGKTCTYNSIVYLREETRREDCNTCSCIDGPWVCTEKVCGAEPIVIMINFDFTNDFSEVAGKEEEFTQDLRQNLQELLNVQAMHIQNITISPGSIKVSLYLVENKQDGIIIETVAVILEAAVIRNSYVFTFDGKPFQSDPNSFKMQRTNSPTPGSSNMIVIIVAVVVCGVVGLLIVIGSICWLVKRRSTTGQLTDYGGERLPRLQASDKVYEEMVVTS